jgi:tripartite ATP-independent transporter DctM subunit
MAPIVIGFSGIVLLLILLFLGVPIGFAMAVAGIVGFAYVVSPSGALHLVASDVFIHFNSYTLSVLPMFILMGCMAYASGIGRKSFDVVYVLMGRLRGGLIVATALGSCIFGALTGSSAATCVAIGKSAVPEMKKRKYDPAISLGALACSGALGFMIPPSVPLAIYGILTEQSIGKLFIAGLLPGILITVLFILTGIIACWIRPEWGPSGDATTLKQKFKSLLGLIDALILFLLVIGGLFAGFFSPTMAGAIGAAGAIVIGLARRELTWKKFLEGLKDSLRLSCMIFILIVGAMIFGHFITATGLSQGLVDYASGLSPLGLIILVCIIFYIFGALLDETPLLLILVPLLFPLVIKSGYDPIWFGVLITALCMVGIVAPPVATNFFVVKGLAGDEVSLMTIIKGIWIFLIPLTMGVVLLIAFPIIATFLPSIMTY